MLRGYLYPQLFSFAQDELRSFAPLHSPWGLGPLVIGSRVQGERSFVADSSG